MAQAQPFAGGTKRFYRIVQKLVGVRAAHAVQDLGFYGLSPVSELPPTCIGARGLKDLSMVLRRATLIPEPYALASTYSNVIPKA